MFAIVRTTSMTAIPPSEEHADHAEIDQRGTPLGTIDMSTQTIVNIRESADPAVSASSSSSLPIETTLPIGIARRRAPITSTSSFGRFSFF